MRMWTRLIRYSLKATVLAAVSLAPIARAADQPQWGQRYTRNMISDEKGLPESIDVATGKNVKWSAKLGSQAHSTPVVGSGKVLIGTNNESPRDPRHQGDRGVLMCFDENTGAFLWQLVVPKREDDDYLDWPKMGLCSPATIEGERTYVITNRDELVCLDLNGLANGNDGPYQDEAKHMTPRGNAVMELGKADADIIWIVDLPAEHGVWQHDSPHGSPLLVGDYLYVNSSNGVDNTHRKIRRPDAPSLMVFDKNTGKLLARDNERIAPRTVHANWSSPSFGAVNGKDLVFFGGGDGTCYAFEPLTPALITRPGEAPAPLKLVWKFTCDPDAPQDDPHNYMGNRAKSASNILGMPVIHDGRVYVAAGGDFWWGKRQSWFRCIDAGKSGDVTRTAEVWSYPISTHCLATASVRDGLLYITDGGKRIHCLDLQAGKPIWTHETKGEMWGSTLVADGKIYAATRRGELVVLAAGIEKKVLHTTDLGAPVSGTPTAANGVLYVATMTHLFAFQQRPPEAPKNLAN